MKEELKTWLQEVKTMCNDYGRVINMDYYVFQTAMPEEQPNLLILNPHPGMVYPFRFHDEDDTLSVGVNIYSVLNPHPSYKLVTSRLSRVFSTPRLQAAVETATSINVHYFNTTHRKLARTPAGRIIRPYCEKKTAELIRSLNPKRILVMTIDGADLKTAGMENVCGIGSYMKTGTICGIKAIAMPSPASYWAFTNSNSVNMGKKIEQYLDDTAPQKEGEFMF